MRPSWDNYFMEMASLVAKRSTCLRRKVGAVIVRDHKILSTGYNGAPTGLEHCTDMKWCIRDKLNIKPGERQELCRALHAEQNAIIQAALSGTAIGDAQIYLTHGPCITCSKMLINCGIRKITVAHTYPNLLGDEFLAEAGVEIVHWFNQDDNDQTNV
jgi:dCMP deaminase